ncbi:MAG: hypothetical protein WKH64_11070 [Chloroflexia bacterium]
MRSSGLKAYATTVAARRRAGQGVRGSRAASQSVCASTFACRRPLQVIYNPDSCLDSPRLDKVDLRRRLIVLSQRQPARPPPRAAARCDGTELLRRRAS